MCDASCGVLVVVSAARRGGPRLWPAVWPYVCAPGRPAAAAGRGPGAGAATRPPHSHTATHSLFTLHSANSELTALARAHEHESSTQSAARASSIRPPSASAIHIHPHEPYHPVHPPAPALIPTSDTRHSRDTPYHRYSTTPHLTYLYVRGPHTYYPTYPPTSNPAAAAASSHHVPRHHDDARCDTNTIHNTTRTHDTRSRSRCPPPPAHRLTPPPSHRSWLPGRRPVASGAQSSINLPHRKIYPLLDAAATALYEGDAGARAVQLGAPPARLPFTLPPPGRSATASRSCGAPPASPLRNRAA